VSRVSKRNSEIEAEKESQGGTEKEAENGTETKRGTCKFEVNEEIKMEV